MRNLNATVFAICCGLASPSVAGVTVCSLHSTEDNLDPVLKVYMHQGVIHSVLFESTTDDGDTLPYLFSCGVNCVMDMSGEEFRYLLTAQPELRDPKTISLITESKSDDFRHVDELDVAKCQFAEIAIEDARSHNVPTSSSSDVGRKALHGASIQNCWNVGSFSSEALQTTVVVEFEVGENGKPELSTVALSSSDAPNEIVERQAYEAARRAVIRCSTEGYKGVEIGQKVRVTFNPTMMRVSVESGN